MAPRAFRAVSAPGVAGWELGPVELYRWDGAAWAPAGPVLAPAAGGGPPRFALAQPGLHAALRDTAPPVLAGGPLAATPHPGYGGVPGVTPPRWTVLAVGARDAGAGLDPATIAARWDGAPLVVEPDLVRDRILVEIPDSARAGDHVLELEARDGLCGFVIMACHETVRARAACCGGGITGCRSD